MLVSRPVHHLLPFSLVLFFSEEATHKRMDTRSDLDGRVFRDVFEGINIPLRFLKLGRRLQWAILSGHNVVVHVETPLVEAWPRMTPGKGKEAYDDRAEGKRRTARRPNAKAFGVEG